MSPDMSLTFQPPSKADDAECHFRKLPSELVWIIFGSIDPDNLLQEYPWPTDSKPITKLTSPVIAYLSALAISAVCTEWRFIALASPRLWSQFRLEIASQRGWSSDVQGGFISTLQLYLDRSADLPLQIDIETEGSSVKFRSLPAALNLLFDHCYRWKKFSFTGNHNVIRSFPRHLSFPILEDLGVGHYSVVQMPRLHCFARAPNLCALRANDLHKETWIPWNQLASLDIRIVDNRNIHLCHNLSALTLRSSYSSSSTAIMSLTSLKSLTLAFSGRERHLLERTLDTCTFSSLGELIITPSLFNHVWPVHAFDAFISRSSCILTTLSIGGVEISDSDLLAAFRILPYLVNFAISEQEGSHPITFHFISRMHASSTSSEILLPKLRTLSLTLLGTSFDDAAFTRMISSRWLPDPERAAAIGADCLRSLVLRFREREVNQEMYGPLYDLNRMGMRVVVAGLLKRLRVFGVHR